MILSSNFSIKTYKLANQEEWKGFERGKDLRIQICWKGNRIWEWILEKTFWIQRNTNKEDRTYMRNHADIKITACKNALIKKSPTKQTTKTPIKKIGYTQDLFENAKKKK